MKNPHTTNRSSLVNVVMLARASVNIPSTLVRKMMSQLLGKL